MTADASVAPAPAPPSPPPWTRIAWVTWRQHRAALAGILAVFGALAVVAVAAGIEAHVFYSRYQAMGCGPSHFTSACENVANAFGAHPLDVYPAVLSMGTHALPVLAGMFLGAPLLARELESGTVRFAWTQGTSRTRWLLVKLGLLAAAVTAAAGVLGILIAWALSPFDAIGLANRWQPGQFDETAVTLAAWTLLGFAFGACAGALIRRTVPAMAGAAAGVAALTGAAFARLDSLLLTLVPVVTHGPLRGPGASVFLAGPGVPGAHGGWVAGQWFTGPAGGRLGVNYVFASAGNPKLPQLMTWMSQHHLTFWWSYQPAGRYWLFQAGEASALVLLALALGAATVWLARRRAV